MKKYIGSRKFYRELFFVCLPLIIQFFVQQSVNFLDNIMVGDMGEEAIAAVGIANQYYRLYFPLVFATGAGATIFTAQYFGAKNFKKLKQTFGFKLVWPMVIAVVFVICGYLFKYNIVDFFIEDGNVLTRQYAVDYLEIMILSFIPYAVVSAFATTLRPIGKAKIPMYISSIAMLINLVFNYLLIFGNFGFPELGVKGAAIATVIARCFEAVAFVMIYIVQDIEFKGSFKELFTIEVSLQKAILKKMIPLLINEFGFTTASIFIFKAFAHTGTKGLALVSIVDIIFFMFMILVNGLGTASSIFIGNRLGANKLEEAEQNSYWMLSYGVIMASVVMVMIIVFSPLLPELYNIDQELKDIIKWALILRSLTVIPMMITRVTLFILRNGGRATETLIIDGVFMWLVKVPLALILSYVFEANILVVYTLVHFTQFPNALISIYFFKKKKWLKNLAVE